MSGKLPKEYCNLNFDTTITRWDEAIPLGNGLCGALIWGPSDGLRFSLDRGDIWDATPYEGIRNEEFSYPNMVKLAREGNIDEIRRIFDAPYNQSLPSKLPAGKLIFDFGAGKKVRSQLDLACAEAVITIEDEIQLKAFMHSERKIGCIQISKPYSSFALRIENPEYGREGEVSDDQSSLKALVYRQPEIVQQGGVSYFVQEISGDFSYGIFTQVKECGNVTEIVYIVADSNDGENWKEDALEMLEDASQEGYDALRKSHAAWWHRYWQESSLTLPDKFFEKNWYLAQYLLASCSRKGCWPMPLQGVWTADDGKLPPWKGDYHFDLNVQMSYYSYLKANHLEEGECLLDYLWKMADCGRRFAKEFYHAQGLCLPSTMTLTGEPLGGWGMYSLSPTNQIWLCQLWERHYRYTGDLGFLREKAYPYMAETGIFIESLLEERDGKFYLPISSLPEIHDDNIESFVTPNSNYDLALMRYLFGALVQLSKKLENGEEARWEAVLERLPALAVNEKGVFMLSPDEELMESHRHFSHAMGIHPLRLLPYEGEENCRIIDATILDLERLGTGYWVGFSFTWMAELYAIQRNGNGAAYHLDTFWKQYCSPNGFHLNGDYQKFGTSTFHYRPFTLEANFCAADALQEMLLQSENHILHIFPAIPKEWEKDSISFDSLRAEGGILVSASMEKGEIVRLTLKPQTCGKVRIKKTRNIQALMEKGGQEMVSGTKEDNYMEMELQGGREYTFCKE